MGLWLFYHIYSFTPYGGQTINHEGKRRSCDGPMDRTEVNPIGQIAPNWVLRLRGPRWSHLLSAVQVHTTTHCRLYREHNWVRSSYGCPCQYSDVCIATQVQGEMMHGFIILFFVTGHQRPLPRTCSCRYNVVIFYKHEGRAVVVVIVLLPRTCSCRYNVVVFYKHEGGRRGRDRTTPKNLQL
jgi:hypothetical protein